MDFQSISQFADRNADAAGAEVVAFFDQTGALRIAEQPLNLAFFRSVALLDFAGADF